MECEYREPEPVKPQPVMIPVKQFTAYSESGEPVDIVGIHYEDEEYNFVGIVSADCDEVFPSIIRYPTYRQSDD